MLVLGRRGVPGTKLDLFKSSENRDCFIPRVFALSGIQTFDLVAFQNRLVYLLCHLMLTLLIKMESCGQSNVSEQEADYINFKDDYINFNIFHSC